MQTVGNMHRANELIDSESSSRILRAVKAHGFNMSHLADAALALAVFAGNPVPPEKATDAHFTMDPCVYVLWKRLAYLILILCDQNIARQVSSTSSQRAFAFRCGPGVGAIACLLQGRAPLRVIESAATASHGDHQEAIRLLHQ